jgi:hypothetical protein
VKFSTYSRYFTEDEELARGFLELVHKHNGKWNLYSGLRFNDSKTTGFCKWCGEGIMPTIHRPSFLCE